MFEEFAFLQLNVEVIVVKNVKRLLHVIHINEEPFSDQLMDEQIVHYMLEGGRRIAQTEEHNHQFEQSIFCDEHGFPFMSHSM